MMIEDGASVDSVTGELTTRLGAVGGVAGEAVRRSVRDAAGGAQTVALLMQADTAGAQRVEPADTAAATEPAHVERPASTEHPARTGAADHYLGSTDQPPRDPAPDPPGPAASTDPQADRSDSAAVPQPVSDAHQAPDTREHTEAPPPADMARHPKPAGPVAGPPGPAQDPTVPALAAEGSARTPSALPPMDPVAAAPAESVGHTPWTTGARAEQETGQAAGSTPWNSGAGSSMPLMPGMPGGMGSLTPQERPPRGAAPWSRGRENKEDGVFPRPRPKPDRPASTNRTEWAPP